MTTLRGESRYFRPNATPRYRLRTIAFRSKARCCISRSRADVKHHFTLSTSSTHGSLRRRGLPRCEHYAFLHSKYSPEWEALHRTGRKIVVRQTWAYGRGASGRSTLASTSSRSLLNYGFAPRRGGFRASITSSRRVPISATTPTRLARLREPPRGGVECLYGFGRSARHRRRSVP